MMPQLGETVTEGTITRWMKGVGEAVERDEPLFEVSTDKVDSEVPSPAAGVLTEILVPEGETVEVGVQARRDRRRRGVAGRGRDDGGRRPGRASGAPRRAGAAGGRPTTATTAHRHQRRAANAAAGTNPAGAGHGRRARRRRRGPAPLSHGAQAALGERDQRDRGHGHRRGRSHHPRRRAARRRDAPRVSDGDTDAGCSAPAAARAPPAPVFSAPAAPPVSMASFRAAGDQVVPFSNMRRRTAEHMVRSKATSPHAFIANEVDFESVERVRRAWGERFKAEEGFSLTYLPFVARAAVEALRDFPLLNASVVDDSLLVHAEVNLGIAVDLSHEGLIVPVIHRAEEVTLRGVARRIRDLAERARGRQLNADDIAGGTFSITNDGPFGTYFTVPIINQPQVAILATDGIARRPVVVTQPDGSESIAIHSTGILGVSWDHRAVDGAYVSLFLARVSELLSSRDWGAEL